jgi:hypothetical protein
MPYADPDERREYDKKRYELKLLRAGLTPRKKSTRLDRELEEARENFRPVATAYGGRFAIGTPLIIEDEPDYTEDVDEADYDPDNYKTVMFRDFIGITTDELDELEQELETFTEDKKNEETVAKLADMIKTRIADAEFKYDGVTPIRRRILFGIVNDLKRAGMLRRPDFKKLAKELDDYF